MFARVLVILLLLCGSAVGDEIPGGQLGSTWSDLQFYNGIAGVPDVTEMLQQLVLGFGAIVALVVGGYFAFLIIRKALSWGRVSVEPFSDDVAEHRGADGRDYRELHG